VSRDVAWRVPGRVNLIGEHTDYNEGLVLPLAINRSTVVRGAPRGDGELRARSDVAGEGLSTYVGGAASVLRARDIDVAGADLVVEGDLPVGAGLSSSAALAVGAVAVLAELSGVDLSADDLAVLAWRAENEFVGVPSGTMDQTVVACGRAGHALLLDTRSGERRHVPFAPEREGLALLVVDTGVRRRLADGRYAARRRECERAAAALGAASLRDVTIAQVHEDPGLDDVLRRRARHVVTENQRVMAVVAALEGDALASIGAALLEGHASLRDDFEVSCPELDLVVTAAMDAGAIGARMTGGGFGGSAIVLVAQDELPAIERALVAAFSAAGLGGPVVFAVRACEGAQPLPIP
jgi:galactokinase